MNVEQLLTHFDRIADAPDAIPRLRRFILDLAVRGKLVEQDPNDEPAEALLQRARTSKTRVMVERKIGSNIKPELSVSAGEDVSPAHWVWTHLYDFALVLGGKRLPAGETFSAHVTKNIYIRVSDMKGQSISTDDLKHISDEVRAQIAKYTIERTDLYITIAGTIGNVGEVPEQFHGQNLTENAAKIVFREIDKRFLLLVLQSADIQSQFQEKIKQMAQPKLALKRISGIRIPLPPLAEQHRIVAKVDELMALCDRLEATRTERETTRNRLTATSLARLNTPDPDPAIFQNHAAFALNNLVPLTTRPDQIKALRQTILNLAVRGKLVPQDPNDESAAELLKRIVPEKQRLVAEGKFKSLDTTEFNNEVENVPFSIPANWVWCRLDDIAAIARGGSPRPIKAYLTDDKNGINWIKIGDSERGNIYINETKEKIRPDGLKKSRMVFPNDLILSNSMSFGYPHILNIQGCIHDGWLVIRTPASLLDKLFLYNLLLSSYSRNAFSNAAAGAVVQNLNADKVRRLPVPLPPLAEQHRIVTKVDELIALCDRLEAILAAGDETQGRLLDALLHEALEPGTGQEAA